MPPPGKKKPLRTPDGRPEFRTPDQILRDAAASIGDELPPESRKLDLDAYFRSGDEHRIANRLLRDNGVLPQHLQDRKDAEQARHAAEQDLEHQIRKLEDLSERVTQLTRALIGSPEIPLGTLDHLRTDTSPDTLEAAGTHDALEMLNELTERVVQFDRRRTDTLSGYREALGVANEATDRYHKHIAATGRLLTPYRGDARIDIDRHVEKARLRMPERPGLGPDDLEILRESIRRFRSIRERIRRLFAAGTRVREISSKG